MSMIEVTWFQIDLLKPTHKVKYDYLYIQKRSVLLNIYILLQTVPVLFAKKGW